MEKIYLVAGAGKSGIGAAGLLLRQNEKVVLYDGNEKCNKDEIAAKVAAEAGRTPASEEFEIFLGEMSDELINRAKCCVISPGIAPSVPFARKLTEAGVPLWSEIELAFRYEKGKLAAITGTNGKTTTTALVGEILAAAYPQAFVVGNIGIPYTNDCDKTREETATVAEISSFQLETSITFHPHVSAILNITPDHLNRHGDMETYTAVKEKIAANQTKDDICVLNYEDERLRAFAAECPAKVVFFSSAGKMEEGFYLDGDKIMRNRDGQDIEVIGTNELNIIGKHNHENVMAAAAIAEGMGVDFETIARVCRKFKAVEHRIEFVAEKNGVVYYNDSKGTNPDASIQALKAMTRPTILMAGGYDKKNTYDEYIEAFEGKVKLMILLGQTGPAIEACANKHGFTDCVYADSMEQAVQIAKERSVPGDAVLLSPACASWGMFPNYEVRGKIFKECVRKDD